jgi:hypothetical protein
MPSSRLSSLRSASVSGGWQNSAATGRPRGTQRSVGMPSCAQRAAISSDGTITRSTAASRQERCAVMRSVMTVATGTAGARVARAAATALLARAAGSAVIGWKATISAGRTASAARATLP